MKPVFLMTVGNAKYSRYTVTKAVLVGPFRWERSTLQVIAANAKNALAAAIESETIEKPTTFSVLGPKGGQYIRHIGWDAIFAAMRAEAASRPRQIDAWPETA